MHIKTKVHIDSDVVAGLSSLHAKSACACKTLLGFHPCFAAEVGGMVPRRRGDALCGGNHTWPQRRREYGPLSVVTAADALNSTRPFPFLLSKKPDEFEI